MSLALIEQTAAEVRRLAIAGSPLAVGDFRLKKLIPPLEQAGAKVPVFAQVAKAMSDVVNGPEKESAARLLNLSTLLNAILYTQGQSGATGDFSELEVFAAAGASTRTPARVLKPLVQALTSSGGGRFEVIKSAVERGAFNDLRLIDPAIQALGDNYPELADLVAEKILPGFGPGIVPRLKAMLDLKGKRSDARTLQVMHRLDPAGTLELCKTALEEGSVEVKAAAIACLGKHEDCLPLVLEQANAKNKALRAAALEALAEHDRPEVTKLFTDLVKGKALDLLAGPFRALRNQPVLNSLLAEGQRVFDLILNGEPEQIARFNEILNCLEWRRDAEVESFLLSAFAKAKVLSKVKAPKTVAVSAGLPPGLVRPMVVTGADLLVNLAMLLYRLESPKAMEALLENREVLPASAFSVVIRSAFAVWPPEKVFAEFSPLLMQKKGFALKELHSFIYVAHADRALPEPGFEVSARPARQIQWDPRWLDAAIAADEPGVVCQLARSGHPASVDYLLKLPASKKTFDPSLTVQALARCQYPKVTDYFLEQVTKKAKGAIYYDYELQNLLRSAACLPSADLPRLDAFAAKLDEKFVDHFLEAIAPLRNPVPESTVE